MVLSALLVKMSAINRIMHGSKKLKRVTVSHKNMLRSLGLLVLITLIFLIAWTVISPPQAVRKLVLPEEQEPFVESSMICVSKQTIWPYLSEGWRSSLLIVASVLAFQSRGIIPDFNESRTIGTMVYSHFLFMVFRVIAFALGTQGFIAPNVLGACICALYTFDTLFATAIYVIPKCIEAHKNPQIHVSRGSITSSGVNISRLSYQSSTRGDSRHARRMTYHVESDIPSSNLRGRQQTRKTSFSSKGALSSESFAMNYGSAHEEPPSYKSWISMVDKDSGTEEEVKFVARDGESASEADQIKSLDGSNGSSTSIEVNKNSIMEEVQSSLSDGRTATEPDQMKLSIVSDGTFSTKNLSAHDACTANDDEAVTSDQQLHPLPSSTDMED